MKNSDKPINPCLMQQVGENEFRASRENDPKEWRIPTEGLTKREYFAGLMLQGILASGFQTTMEKNVEAAIEHTDELLKQLEN